MGKISTIVSQGCESLSKIIKNNISEEIKIKIATLINRPIGRQLSEGLMNFGNEIK